MFVKVVQMGRSPQQMEKELNKALKEISEEYHVVDVKVVNNGNPNVNCYAVILCEPYVHETEKDIIDEKILDAISEEDRRHYAARFGIPYPNGESSNAKGEEKKET